MKDSRIKNASRNMIWGGVNKTVVLILPFITRTIILYMLGASYLGVGTLFSSILSFLSLTELGLSAAIVYVMYKPLAENDTKTICALLNYYRNFYRIIGIVMLAIGTGILPLVPMMIQSGSPDGINIYILYYIYLINSVVSYFFAGYRSSLLIASQREDISTKILTIVNILVQFGQIVVLVATKNFYFYAIVPIVGTLATNTLYYIITRKKYPEYRPEGKLDSVIKTNIKKKISGLIGTKLNSIVVHSADTIVISTFLGLTLTAQYGNYYLIFNSVCNFIGVFFSSITAGIGNKLVLDNMTEGFKLFKRISYINGWIVCWCCSCFLCLYEPFMKIWVGEDLMLGLPFTVLMVLYFFVYQIQKTILTFKDAAGLWHVDKIRPYCSMIINVVSNIILVQYIGIYGIVISSILAFLISLPWANKVLFEHLFRMNAFANIKRICKYFVLTVGICVASYGCCMICADGIGGLVQRLVICCLVPNILFVLMTYKTEEANYCLQLVGRFVKKMRMVI